MSLPFTLPLQSDVCAAALSEVIPAVLEGSDGCLLAMGYPGTGQPQTVLGELGTTGGGSLGAAPCAIAWLYKGIQERRQKSGARFSVRVSAVGVNATKPDALSTDLLISHAAGKHEGNGKQCHLLAAWGRIGVINAWAGQHGRGLGVSSVMLPLGHEDDDDAKGKEANCGSVAPQFE